MAGVIKAGQLESHRQHQQTTAFSLEDIQKRGETLLDNVRQQAAKILEDAQEEAARIRAKATEQGEQDALLAAETKVRAEMEEQAGTLLPALEQMLHEMQLAKEEWTARWNTSILELAAAIAEKIIRRELTRQPEVSIELLRESLEMASGAKQIQLRFHPQDIDSLGQLAARMAAKFEPLGQTVLHADESVEPGFCKIVTEFGEIDQTLATQLERIVDELK